MDPHHITEAAQISQGWQTARNLPEVGMTGILSRRLPAPAFRWCAYATECDHGSRETAYDNIRLSTGLITLWYQHLSCDSTKQTVRGRLMVSGAWPHAVKVPYLGVLRSELIMIRPGAARAVFGIPASEFASRRIALDDLLPGEGSRLEQRLLEEGSGAGRHAILTEWIARRAQQHARSTDLELVDGIRRWIGMCGQHRDISAMAGGSQRSIQRWFNDCVGISPRDIGRLWQVGRAAREAMTTRKVDWSALAFRHGFYDQPHLVRRWSYVIGMTPTQMMQRWRRGGRWVQGMILLPTE